MTLPLTGDPARWLAIPFGILFGVLLHRGGVANYNVIVNQFRFRDFTVLKIMLTAIICPPPLPQALHHSSSVAEKRVVDAGLRAREAIARTETLEMECRR